MIWRQQDSDTYEKYNNTTDEWYLRVYYSAANDGEWLIVNKSKISLPDYIEGTAKGTMRLMKNGVGRLVKQGTMAHPSHADGRVMFYWYFVDDKNKKPINIDEWPKP